MEIKGDTEDNSASKSTVEKPPSTPEMGVRDAEDMANAMLLDSPLPDIERSDEKLPEDGGSGKLPEEEDDGEKLPEGGDGKLPELQVNLYHFVLRKYFFFALNFIK